MNKKRVSIKNYLKFSLAMFPFWSILMIYYEKLLHIFKSEALFLIMVFLLFSAINWLYGQKKLNRLLVVIPNVILFFALSLSFVHFDYTNLDGFVHLIIIFILTIPITAIIYLSLFIIVLFLQIFTWIPFLINFIYHNRKNLGNLRWN